MAGGVNEPQHGLHPSDEHTAGAQLPTPVSLPGTSPTARIISPHSNKFRAATGLLVGVAIGAITVALVLLVTGGSGGPGPDWSSWSPQESGIAGEREIADQISPLYRASPSTQLTVVTVQNISGSGSANGGTQLAVRDPSTGTLSAVPGTSAVYSLCGFGANCAINAGTPSAARLLLLRREALELALYTFKYIGGVQNVVALLPPGHTSSSCTGICPKPPSATTPQTTSVNLAVVFQKDSLKRLLDQPLPATLPEEIPPTVSQMPAAPEAELVSVLTSQALFQQQMVQAQDGSNVLVLNPQPAQ